jgi:excisionase family DNA binding protein
VPQRFPTVLTVTVAAERLATTPETILAELEAGQLKGFKVGGEWRTTEQDLLAFMGHPPSANREPVADAEATDAEEQPALPPVQVAWHEIDPFSFTWPTRAGADPDEVTEHHDQAFAATVPFRGRRVPVRIGFTDRTAAGMERKRVNVFLESGSTLIPLVQFVGTNDHEETGRLASVIKKEDGPHLRPGEPVPEEYRDLPRCVYSEVVVGKNAARSVAVLAHRDDLALMARHGLIRARWKGLL